MNVERRRIEYVTKISNSLHGLPNLIIGLTCLLPAVWRFLIIPLLASYNVPGRTLGWAGTFAWLLLVVLAVYLSVASVKFYRRTYGRVRLEKRAKLKIALKEFLCVIPALLAFSVGLSLDYHIHPPISVSFLCFAMFSFVLWFASGRGISNHQLWLGIIITGLSLFPLLALPKEAVYAGFPREEVYGFSIDNYFALLCGICGLILATDGLFQHLILVRTLKSLPKEEGYEFV